MSTRHKVLIVDDEPDIRDLLTITLKRMDIPSQSAANLAEARELLSKENYFLCLADMRLPDGDGIDLVRYIQQACPALPVAMITAYGNVEGAVNTLKAGAFDYVSKPVDLAMIRRLVNTALKLVVQVQNNAVESKLIGQSKEMTELKQTIEKVARSQAPVHIFGPSGSGKELVARMIHDSGPRSDKPFVPINCGAVPGDLMESEFFGHKKGSFTGAHSDKVGLFQAADGGTLFLDEIAELPQNMQVKLLRVIQEKTLRRVGDESEMSVDVRLLSATHKSLSQLVQSGGFRQDLYYRINVIEVKVPPLCHRLGDLPDLIHALVKKIAIFHQQAVPTITQASMEKLLSYQYPGNIRELENILERAMTLCENNIINENDVDIPEHEQEKVKNTVEDVADLDAYLDAKEKEMIMKAIERNHGNKTHAAKELGLSFRALRYRLKKLGLD